LQAKHKKGFPRFPASECSRKSGDIVPSVILSEYSFIGILISVCLEAGSLYLHLQEVFLPKPRVADAAAAGTIEEAAQIIRDGGLVAFPTETVYGLGADARNAKAVARIFEVKARPRIDPLIIHVADPQAAKRYGKFPEFSFGLMAKFWPGPLTLVVEKTSWVPPIVTAGLETVAIRIPSHPVALALIEKSACAIAAPSANPFGYVSPTEARHVVEQLGDSIDLILDGGPCAIGLESTILSLAGPAPCILRTGGTPIEKLQDTIGTLDIRTGVAQQVHAPGQLARHYATHTRLEIADEASENQRPGERIGLLCLTVPSNPQKYAAIEVLSPTGNLREAAANLFSALRRLDSVSLDRIVARPVREEGLGLAIMDRLHRCSTKRRE
jgi:L-threonylcarbamoyladenylate synthase